MQALKRIATALCLASLAFAAQADPITRVDPRRHFDGQRLLLADTTLPAAEATLRDLRNATRALRSMC